MQILFKYNPESVALWIVFIKSGLFVIATTYANTLFISSYPKEWLVYFYSTQALCEAFFYIILINLFRRNRQKTSIILIQVITILTIGMIILLQLNFYWMSFIFSVFLVTADNFVYLISWSSIRLSFDVISFKQINTRLRFAGYIGSVVFGGLILIILHFFNYHIIVYLIPFIFIATIYFLKRINIIEAAVKIPRGGLNPFKYNLFRQLIIYMLLLALCNILIDFCLKYELAASFFKTTKLANFIGIYLIITRLLSGLLTAYFLSYMVSNFAINYLLLLAPIYWLCSAIFIQFYPSLNSIIFLAAGSSLLPLTYFGIESLLSYLPTTIQFSSRFIIQIFTLIFIAIAMPIIFSLIFKGSKIQVAVYLIFIFCIAMLIIAFKLKKSYIETLKTEMQIKGFKFFDEYIVDQPNIAPIDPNINQANKAISDLAQMVHWSGLNDSTTYVNLEKPATRIKALKTIIHSQLNEALPILITQFMRESNPKVIWWFFVAIGKIQPKTLESYAKKNLNSSTPSICAGSIYILLLLNDEMDKIKAAQKLKEMITSTRATMRLYAIYVLEQIWVENFNVDVNRLIYDDARISKTAMIVASKYHLLNTVFALVHILLKKKVISSTAKKALYKLGPDIIPILHEIIIKKSRSLSSHYEQLIRILAMLRAEKAESVLLDLSIHKLVNVRRIATQELAHRVKIGVPKSAEFNVQVKTLIDKAYHHILYLYHLSKEYRELFVIKEIESRLSLAKEEFLYLIATISATKEIIDLIPIILTGRQIEYAKALELLLHYVKNHQLESMIQKVFLTKKSLDIIKNNFRSEYEDEWLGNVLIYSSIQKDEQMNMNKVFLLRSVELFNKLPAEVLMLVAKELTSIPMLKGQTIFLEGDLPNGLYILVSGEVEISRNGHTIAILKPAEFFGELALIDNEVRSATAVARTEGLLYFMDTDTFYRLTNDFPEVLFCVTKVILKYLRAKGQ